jgi:hypothetical protein
MEGVFTVCGLAGRRPTGDQRGLALILVFALVIVFPFVVVRVHPNKLAVFGDLDFDFLAIGFLDVRIIEGFCRLPIP